MAACSCCFEFLKPPQLSAGHEDGRMGERGSKQARKILNEWFFFAGLHCHASHAITHAVALRVWWIWLQKGRCHSITPAASNDCAKIHMAKCVLQQGRQWCEISQTETVLNLWRFLLPCIWSRHFCQGRPSPPNCVYCSILCLNYNAWCFKCYLYSTQGRLSVTSGFLLLLYNCFTWVFLYAYSKGKKVFDRKMETCLFEIPRLQHALPMEHFPAQDLSAYYN